MHSFSYFCPHRDYAFLPVRRNFVFLSWRRLLLCAAVGPTRLAAVMNLRCNLAGGASYSTASNCCNCSNALLGPWLWSGPASHAILPCKFFRMKLLVACGAKAAHPLKNIMIMVQFLKKLKPCFYSSTRALTSMASLWPKCLYFILPWRQFWVAASHLN